MNSFGMGLGLDDDIPPIIRLTSDQSGGLDQVDLEINMNGAHTVTIDWGDGNTSAVSGTGSTYSSTYGATENFDIQIYGRIDKITKFYLAGGATLACDIATFKPCNALTSLELIYPSITGNIANLPPGMTGDLCLYYTSVSGDIANLPSGLDGNLNLGYTSVSGDLANLPAGLTGDVEIYVTEISAYTAESWPCDTGNEKAIDFYDTNLTSDECDAVLCHLDAHGATGGTLDVSENSIPSATGLACKDSLEGKDWFVGVDS